MRGLNKRWESNKRLLSFSHYPCTSKLLWINLKNRKSTVLSFKSTMISNNYLSIVCRIEFTSHMHCWYWEDVNLLLKRTFRKQLNILKLQLKCTLILFKHTLLLRKFGWGRWILLKHTGLFLVLLRLKLIFLISITSLLNSQCNKGNSARQLKCTRISCHQVLLFRIASGSIYMLILRSHYRKYLITKLLHLCRGSRDQSLFENETK